MPDWEEKCTQTSCISETIYEVKFHRTFSLSICISDPDYGPILDLQKSVVTLKSQ